MAEANIPSCQSSRVHAVEFGSELGHGALDGLVASQWLVNLSARPQPYGTWLTRQPVSTCLVIRGLRCRLDSKFGRAVAVSNLLVGLVETQKLPA